MKKEKIKACTSFLDINHYANLNLKYNPFSYLNDQELFYISEDRIHLEKLAPKIKDSNSCFIEFHGKKGRGKSTHLQLLHYRFLPGATFYKLKKKHQQTIKTTSDILIIDSFQLLSFKNRLELLKNQKKLLITCHYSHSFLSSKKEFNKKINFSKLNLTIELLEKIVTSRIELAHIDNNKPVLRIKTTYLKQLLKKHKNHFREIQSDLYQQFLNLNQDFYEL